LKNKNINRLLMIDIKVFTQVFKAVAISEMKVPSKYLLFYADVLVDLI